MRRPAVNSIWSFSLKTLIFSVLLALISGYAAAVVGFEVSHLLNDGKLKALQLDYQRFCENAEPSFLPVNCDRLRLKIISRTLERNLEQIRLEYNRRAEGSL
jgi:hypothetical protein